MKYTKISINKGRKLQGMQQMITKTRKCFNSPRIVVIEIKFKWKNEYLATIFGYNTPK